MAQMTPCRICSKPIDMTGGFCSVLGIHYAGYRCWECRRAEAVTGSRKPTQKPSTDAILGR